MHKPIILIGSARSGTSFLGGILGLHSKVAYWEEPKYIWKYRKPLANNDIRTASEATRGIRQYIRKEFSRYVHEQHKERFLEKTPSNCFRLPFVYKVFPEALFINIIRDGRDVALSAERLWTGKPSKNALRRRASSLEIPWIDLPFYSFEFAKNVLLRSFYSDTGMIWGPRFEGIKKVRDTHSVLETCAIQWQESVKATREGFTAIPGEQVYQLRYEYLVDNLEEELVRILDFCQLSPEKPMIEAAKQKVMKGNHSKWKTIDKDTLNAIENIIKPELVASGYACW